tara:strand:- start:556 stop:1386 length:831 start_codon:yes stop_codon:yes gene_type:complete
MLGLGNSLYLGGVLTSSSFSNEYSLAFDGVNDILITTKDSSIMPTDNLTAGCWIKPANWAFPGNAQVRYPFGCVATGGWGLQFSNNYNGTITTFAAYIRVSDAGSGGEDYINITAGTGFSSTLRALTGWHYVAFTYDKATGVGSLSLDGVERATANAAEGADIVYHATSQKNLMFGADAYNDTIGHNFFEGNIDEGSVWNKALTSAELVAIYNSGVPIDLLSDSGDYASSSNLQGYWRMGDTAGTSVYPTIEDYSSNSNDGTMTNMASGDIVTDTP